MNVFELSKIYLLLVQKSTEMFIKKGSRKYYATFNTPNIHKKKRHPFDNLAFRRGVCIGHWELYSDNKPCGTGK
ncbi:hypothetical protein ccbrp13_48290 [Ktedonobacteria bacterium brp13]|nr:hypothetical protein ccbrp13_48290 [Ktedonobacteria bacterium brp13]